MARGFRNIVGERHVGGVDNLRGEWSGGLRSTSPPPSLAPGATRLHAQLGLTIVQLAGDSFAKIVYCDRGRAHRESWEDRECDPLDVASSAGVEIRG